MSAALRLTRRRWRNCLTALVVLAWPARGLPAGEVPRGPSEIRDEQLLAQPCLTLPATTPHTVASGAWSVRVALLWSSSFAWSQDVAGELPKLRQYLVDGDALTFDVEVRRGVGDRVDLALRLPLRWRGGGAFDDVIDTWHRLFGFPDNGRPAFRANAFRVEGVTDGGARSFSWNDQHGGAVGDADVAARWRALDGGRGAPSLGLVGRVSLPTGAGPFDGNGLGAGVQAVVALPLASRWEAYAGLGGTVQSLVPAGGISYERRRVHGFAALEWRPCRILSLVAETNAASRLVGNVDDYPGLHWALNGSARLGLGGRTSLDLGFSEGLADQDATTDFALHLALTVRR